MAESDKTLIDDGNLSNNNRKNSAPNIVPLTSGAVHPDTHPAHHAAVSEPSTLKRKQTSFQITSVTVKGSRLSTDGGEDSADDLDESHTEDASSDILDCSRTTDVDNDQLSEDNSNTTTNNDDASIPAPSIPVKCKKELPVKKEKQNDCIEKFPSDASKIVKPTLPCENTQSDCVKPPALPDQWQHRFRVVKIVRSEPFKRGRWLCMDFMDPPAPVTEAKAEIVETAVSSNIQLIGSLSDSIPADKIAHIYEISPSDAYPGSISMAAGSDQNQQPMYGIFLPVNNGQYPLITGMHSRAIPRVERETKPQESAQTVTSTERTIHQPQNTSTISQQPQNVNSQQSQNISTSNLPQSQSTTTYVQQSQNVSANLQQSQNITSNSQQTQNMATIQQPNVSAGMQQSQNASTNLQQQQNIVSNVKPNITTNLQQPNVPCNQYKQQNVSHSTINENQQPISCQAVQGAQIVTSQTPQTSLQSTPSLPQSQNIVKDPVTVVTHQQIAVPDPTANFGIIHPQSQMTQESQPHIQQSMQQQAVSVTPPQSISESATKPNEISSISQVGEISINQSISKQPQIQQVSMAQATTISTQASSVVNIPVVSSTSSMKNPETVVVPSQVIQNHIETKELGTPPSTNLQVSQEVLPEVPSTKGEVNGEDSESVPSGTSTVAIDNKIEQAMFLNPSMDCLHLDLKLI
ncbi:UNVERIFIED_CONTAM: bun [Trichonephila clavipes]